MINKVGIYIHIPFCKSKCYYCDFNSFANKDELVNDYIDTMSQEIRLYLPELKKYRIDTIFIGGGTPSYLDSLSIGRILEACTSKLNVDTDAEISIEANPGTLEHQKLKQYKTMGINRLSIGLQCAQNGILKYLGRAHSKEDFIQSFVQARTIGFDNINVDIIFGIPNQTLKDWINTLDIVCSLEPTHISCYGLTIEDGTVFSEIYQKGQLKLPDEEREMYHTAINILKDKGFKHYEISNFAKIGFECIHNANCWKAGQYIGLGAGAHSYFKGFRFNNVYDIENYIYLIKNVGVASENFQKLSLKDKIAEWIILRLRLTEGFKLHEFKATFNQHFDDIFSLQIKKLQEKRLIVIEDGRVKLTNVGLDLANRVFVEFI